MPLESPVNELADLNEAWPLNGDLQQFADDHLRICKRALRQTFADVGANGGVVSVSAAEMNHLAGVVSNIQQQLDDKVTPWSFITESFIEPTVSSKLLLSVPVGGTTVSLSNSAPDGTEVRVRGTRSAVTIEPDRLIVVQRAGIDTITNLDTGAFGLTSISYQLSREYWTFVRQGSEWLGWQVTREFT